MVNTFLPYADFARSASVLDYRRLGKQRAENLQIANALFRGEGGYSNHPATLMWIGYEGTLLHYHIAICNEWVVGRGYKDTTYTTMFTIFGENQLSLEHYEDPPWLGDREFHRAHQSNLIRKNPDFYGPLFPGVPDDIPYIWPTNEEDFDYAG